MINRVWTSSLKEFVQQAAWASLHGPSSPLWPTAAWEVVKLPELEDIRIGFWEVSSLHAVDENFRSSFRGTQDKGQAGRAMSKPWTSQKLAVLLRHKCLKAQAHGLTCESTCREEPC